MGLRARLEFQWNTPSQCFTMNVLDEEGNAVLLGVPIVTGADLLEQFAYLGIGGQMIAQTSFDRDAVPTYENFGREGKLYFLTP